MHKVNAAGATPSNEFTDGNPQTGTPATTLEASYMNTLQRELVNVVEGADITLDAQNDTQLQLAINQMINAGMNTPTNSFAAGTRMLFVQAAAPQGWTQDNTLNDRVIRVVNSDGSGGSVGGSWTISGITINGHALTINEMPAHNHGGGRHDHSYLAHGMVSSETGANFSQRTLGLPQTPASSTLMSGTVISREGGGNKHIHSATSNGTWRPAYVDVIACIKN